MDVLEPSHFPHVGVPEYGGLSPGALLEVAAQIARGWGGQGNAWAGILEPDEHVAQVANFDLNVNQTPGLPRAKQGGIVGVGVTEFCPRPNASTQQISAACGFVCRFLQELFRDRNKEIGWMGGIK